MGVVRLFLLFAALSFAACKPAAVSPPSATPAPVTPGPANGAALLKLEQKLEQIVIPKSALQELTFLEAIDRLRIEARERDPAGQGFPIVLQLKASVPPPPPSLPDSSSDDAAALNSLMDSWLQDHPPESAKKLISPFGDADPTLLEAVAFVSIQVGMKSWVAMDGIHVAPYYEPEPRWIFEISFPPDFLSWVEAEDRNEETNRLPLARDDLPKYLGIADGSSVTLDKTRTRLTLRGTRSELAIINSKIDELREGAWMPGPNDSKVVSKGAPGGDERQTWEFAIPPDQMTRKALGLPAPGETRYSMPEWLHPPGSDTSATYIRRKHQVVVRSTPAHLERVQQRIEEAWKQYYLAHPPGKEPDR